MGDTEEKVIKQYSEKSISYTSAFTIDVEDGVSIAMRDAFGIKSKQTERVVVNTQKIVCLLEKYNVKATFFILGKVAEDFPLLVKEISNGGHELGVHGYNHLQFFRMTPAEALKELTDAKKLLEDISGKKIIGHRAPAFSVNSNTAWAFDVIAESGFTYDSSVIPIKGGHYGWPEFPKEITPIITTNGAKLIVVPISTTKFFGRDIPYSGGGYLRLFPFLFTNHSFKSNVKNRPTILYIHPYELDTSRYPDYYFDALKRESLLKQLKMRSYWINRKRTYFKLEELLKKYSFSTLKEVIDYTPFSESSGKQLVINTTDGEFM